MEECALCIGNHTDWEDDEKLGQGHQHATGGPSLLGTPAGSAKGMGAWYFTELVHGFKCLKVYLETHDQFW